MIRLHSTLWAKESCRDDKKTGRQGGTSRGDDVRLSSFASLAAEMVLKMVRPSLVRSIHTRWGGTSNSGTNAPVRETFWSRQSKYWPSAIPILSAVRQITTSRPIAAQSVLFSHRPPGFGAKGSTLSLAIRDVTPDTLFS